MVVGVKQLFLSLLRCGFVPSGPRWAVTGCPWPAGLLHLYELERDTLPHLRPQTLPLPGQLHVPAGLIHWRDVGCVHQHSVWDQRTLQEGTNTHTHTLTLDSLQKCRCDSSILHLCSINRNDMWSTVNWMYCYVKSCKMLNCDSPNF